MPTQLSPTAKHLMTDPYGAVFADAPSWVQILSRFLLPNPQAPYGFGALYEFPNIMGNAPRETFRNSATFADTIRFMLNRMKQNVSNISAREGIHPGTTIRLDDPIATIKRLRTLSRPVTEETETYPLHNFEGISPLKPASREFRPPSLDSVQEFINTISQLYRPADRLPF